jgi:hypothetical protein
MRRFLACVVLVAACKGSKPGGTSAGSSTVPTGSGSAAAAPVAADAPVGADAPVAADAPAAGSAGGAGDGSGSAAAGVKRPKEVAVLEAALVALINEPESDERSRKTCGQFMELYKKAGAVASINPAGVDAAAWDAAGSRLLDDFNGLTPYCHDDPPDDSVELPTLYKDFQALVALLPK